MQVVGYICHELRNPLHIVKTSFKSLALYSLKRSSYVPNNGTNVHRVSSFASRKSSASGTTSTMTGRVSSTGTGAGTTSVFGAQSRRLESTGNPFNDSCEPRDDVAGLNLEEDDEELSIAELKSIVSDANAALVQMQTTVNEVLDFRAIESGLNSLKLNKEPAIVTQVS